MLRATRPPGLCRENSLLSLLQQYPPQHTAHSVLTNFDAEVNLVIRVGTLGFEVSSLHRCHTVTVRHYLDVSDLQIQEKMMRLHLNSRVVRFFAAGCWLVGSLALASSQDSSTRQPAPDNTKVNQRKESQSQPTADQQKENVSDRTITQQIRQSLMRDKSLSTYAHNVKIITQNGMVTLKGPVRSDDEKQTVETKAAEIVGKDKVTSELAVKPKE